MEEINIEDFLNSRFKDFEAEPLPGSFNAVMDKAAIAKEKKRRAGFFYALSGVAALLLVYFALPVFENTGSQTRSYVAIKESEASGNIVQGNSINEPVESPLKNKTVAIESGKSNTLKNISAKNEAPSKLSSFKESNPQIACENPKEPEQLFVASQPDQKQSDPGHTQKDAQLMSVDEPENNFALPAPANPGEATSTLNAEILEGITFGAQFKAKENLTSSSFDTKSEKDLLRLQSSRFKARFFAGISCQAIMMEQTYALNSSGKTDPIRYSTDFKSSYIEGRRKESSRNTIAIPGILFGVGIQRFEIRATIGAFQLHDYEIINYPKDSLTAGYTITPFGLGGTGVYGPNSTRSKAPVSQPFQGEQCRNTVNYVYGSLGVNTIFRFYNFRLKPGIAIAYNRSVTGTYVVVDENGYGKYRNSNKHLNKEVYSLSIQCGLSKRLSRLIELQVSPVYMVSLSSVFDKKYFLSQKFNGFGIEGALIYRFPVRLGK